MSRRAGATIGLAFLLMACGATPGTGSSQSVAHGSPPAVNADLLAQLTAAGLPIDDAIFLAATTVEASETAKRTAHVVEHLASGDTVEFTVVVGPPTVAIPGEIIATSTTTDAEIDMQLRYLVAIDGLPTDVRDALTAGARPGVASLHGGPPPVAETSFVEVTVDWAIKKVESTIRDTAIKRVLENIVPKQVGTIMKLIKAGLTVEKGAKIFAELDALLDELAALEDCAKNPTNPLTQKQYQEDPGARDRVLGQIAEARSEIIANTVVIQLGVLNGFAAGFGPKWLGYVIGPGTAWSKATLEELNKQRLEEIKRAVPKCDCATGGQSSGGSTGGSGTGTSGGGTSGGGSSGQTCEFPFIWTGTVDHTFSYDGVVEFTSHATQVKWQLDATRSDSIASLYNLVAATVEWTYGSSHQDGQCTTTLKGSGSESGVPDEAPNAGGEAGPGDPTEYASLTINWAEEPAPTYMASATTRLHDKIQQTNSCHGAEGEIDPDWWYGTSLPTWLTVNPEPGQIVNDKIAGTYTVTVAHTSQTWTWEFTPSK